MEEHGTLENFFAAFRYGIIGQQQTFDTPFGKKEIVYADWTASGRAYQPIETYLQKEIMPFLGNTHTGTTVTGTLMTKAYEEAKNIVKKHVHADADDALVFCGSGMTAAVNKLQRILGLRVPERILDYTKPIQNADLEISPLIDYLNLDETLKPVVFVTHMEHNSNHISWLDTIANVEVINADENGNIDMVHFSCLLNQFKHRKNKIAAITACSNVTGIETPYQQIAKIMHQHSGLCFVDFACSAPYVNIDMHPLDKEAYLDAVYFSPHKFLGGAGTPGVLIFNKKLYKNSIPDQPGGGTVLYTNPWKVHEYISDIEQREDGGTPPILQGIKAAMCIRLKEQMGIENILRREKELLKLIFDRFCKIKGAEVLRSDIKKRLGVVSFMITGAHYNLIVKILNDRFGIQTRGGCSCTGTYGHTLLNVSKIKSYEIYNSIKSGDFTCKPGWIRLSIHPTMTDAEINFIMDAIGLTAINFGEWGKDYHYDAESNEYAFKGFEAPERQQVGNWFNAGNWVILENHDTFSDKA